MKIPFGLPALNVIFNGILAVTTVLLFLIARQQNSDSRAQHRPWMGIVPPENSTAPWFLIDPDRGFAAAFPIKNVGASPALETGVVSRTRIAANPPKDAQEWTDKDWPPFRDCLSRASVGSKVAVFPGQTLSTLSEGDRIDLDTRNAVLDNQKTMFVVGCVRYRDDAGIYHHTEFCFHLGHEKGTLRGAPLLCPAGNRAD